MYRRQPGTAWSFSPPLLHHHPPGIWGRRFWGPTPESLAGSWHWGGARLTHFGLSPETAALVPGAYCTAAPPRGCPPVPPCGGGPGGRPPRDGCLELNPLRLHYRPQSPEPWLLSRGAQHGEGGERDERDVALSAPLPPPAQGAPQEDEEKPPPSLTPPKSIQPRHRGGGGGFAPPGHSWMASR